MIGTGRRLPQAILLGAIALSGTLAAQVMGARLQPAPVAPTTDAITHVPERIGTWLAVKDLTVPVNPARPDSNGRPGQVYDAMVSRTYLAPDGSRVMLMLAYQTQQFQEDRVHSPELCYYAQGYVIKDQKNIQLRENELNFSARFFTGNSISRNESVIYWIRTGNLISQSSLATRGEIFASGIKGKIDDGILVRVSMVDAPGESHSSDEQIAMMTGFLRELLAASPADSRLALLGRHER